MQLFGLSKCTALALQMAFAGAQIPDLQKIVMPSYPTLLRRALIQGNLRFHLKISEGKITSITSDKSGSQNPLLRKHGLQLIEKWTFTDSYSGDRDIELRFKLVPFSKDPHEFIEDSEIEISQQSVITITGRYQSAEPVKVY